MANTFINTNDYRYRNALNFLNDVSSSNNDWYFFVGQSLPQTNAQLQPLFEYPYSYIQAWENMSFGKAIGANNVFLMINNTQWVGNTVYSMYDDKDITLSTDPFFVVENEGSFWHVWKCLDNNNGANSTVQPTFAFAESTPYYESSDGYRWKYMCSTDAANVGNFATSIYFPFISNNSVAQAATNGSIDIIKVQGGGQFYNNYIDGSFKPGDIVSTTIFNLSNNVVQKINGYYTGCLLYLSGGTGAGQFTEVVDFQCNTTGSYIQTANSFVIPPDNSTTYQLRPSVQIVGNGTETVNCIARALVNAFAGNSVYRCEVLQNGRDYLDASATVIANVYVAVSNTANVRAILPPRGGHGSHQHEELYCNSVGIFVFLSNTESNTIPASAIYQQLGLMRNPLFANVYLSFQSTLADQTTGTFLNGETVFSCINSQLVTNATANVGNSTIQANLANFVDQVSVGEYLYITSQNSGAASLNQIANVVNTSTLILTSNSLISDANAILYVANITGNAVVTFVNATAINVNGCPGTWATGTSLIGSNSGATGLVQSVTRNGITKSFNTFVQLYQFTGSQTGNLVIGETVTQGNTSAILYGIADSNTLFQVSNFNNSNNIFTNGVITGATSGATATLTGSYAPELIFQSGDIMYLQNIDPVQRANNQIESFQFVLNF